MTRQLAQIKKELIPWIRHWDVLDENEEPQPLPEGILKDLITLWAEKPDNEPLLRELLNVQCLLGNTSAAIRLLKRIIELPGKTKPKQIVQDKMRLTNLQRMERGEETNIFLCEIGLSRTEFVNLGRFLEKESVAQDRISVSDYPLCHQWAVEVSGRTEENWQALRTSLFNAGAFGDFGVREAFFDLTD
ncbi:MAG: hypothetical protein GXX96_01730 [Planctomycetaceae bacterium]|nr:hypothetical protein [Planctomycetaceae bacterium]